MKLNVDFIYPVGSIYMSTNSTNPNVLFGGNWEQIKDTFLLACGNTYANGSKGGEATHKLTVGEMPKHTHSSIGNWAKDIGTSGYGAQINQYSTGYIFQANYFTSTNTGGDAAHNNMPPYLAVYVWKRIA